MDDISTDQILSDYAKDNVAPPSSDVKDVKVPSPQESKSTEPAAKFTTAADKPVVQKFKYKTEGGKEVEEDIETILKRAGLGYHAAQRLEGVNKVQEEYKKAQERIKELARWEEYDKYAKEKPEWNEHVQKSWQDRDKALVAKSEALPDNDPQQQVIATVRQQILDEIKKEFAPVANYIETMQKRDQEQATIHSDRQFDSEVKSVRSAFPNVDFDQADEHGRALEYRVLNHMTENKIPSFKAAFLDLEHARLLDRAKQDALEQYAKDKKSDAKKGIIGKSSTPQAGELQGLSNGKVRTTGYDQIGDLIKQELGLM